MRDSGEPRGGSSNTRVSHRAAHGLGAKQAATLLPLSRKTSISILNRCRAATDTALILRGAIHFLPDLPPEANPFPWEND